MTICVPLRGFDKRFSSCLIRRMVRTKLCPILASISRVRRYSMYLHYI